MEIIIENNNVIFLNVDAKNHLITTDGTLFLNKPNPTQITETED
ncbi:hypothetical protein [Acinetobacter sp.]|nr:hypothetical protein [Acinetobacter sp.]